MTPSLNKNKIICVTGGCGYVGSRVVQSLVEEGYQVVAVDAHTPKERGVVFPQGVEFRKADLRVPHEADDAIKGSHAIMHLAANIGPLTYMHKYQADIVRDNKAIDAAVFPACVKEGVEVIIISSSSMVFQHAQRYPYCEEDLRTIPPPTNPYGFSKLAGEYFCKSFQAQYNLPYVILRYHNIYGPGEDSKGSSPGDIHVIPALIEKVLSGQYPLVLLGGEDATRPFMYVDDAINATIIVLKAAIEKNKKVINNDFNIGPKKATKILDLAKMIWELLGDGRPFAYEVQATKADTSKRRELDPERIYSLGWKESVSLEDGIQKTAEWVKNRK